MLQSPGLEYYRLKGDMNPTVQIAVDGPEIGTIKPIGPLKAPNSSWTLKASH